MNPGHLPHWPVKGLEEVLGGHLELPALAVGHIALHLRGRRQQT